MTTATMIKILNGHKQNLLNRGISLNDLLELDRVINFLLDTEATSAQQRLQATFVRR
jgi:hypothetical protein